MSHKRDNESCRAGGVPLCVCVNPGSEHAAASSAPVRMNAALRLKARKFREHIWQVQNRSIHLKLEKI